MEITKLEYVNVRDIWANEATHFIRWLAEHSKVGQ